MTALGACYKQLNSSVGEFGTDTLQAATKAIESTSPGDSKYLATDSALRALELARDQLALRIKGELEAAAFGNAAVHDVLSQIAGCNLVIASAHLLDKVS